MEGLKTCNILELLQSHPDIFKKLLCSDKQQLNFDTVNELFSIKLNEVGTNARQHENRIVAFWRDYLLDCQGRVNFLFIFGKN